MVMVSPPGEGGHGESTSCVMTGATITSKTPGGANVVIDKNKIVLSTNKGATITMAEGEITIEAEKITVKAGKGDLTLQGGPNVQINPPPPPPKAPPPKK